MKHIHRNTIFILNILAVTGSPLPLCATDPLTVRWNQVCKVTAGHELSVTTTTGETVNGFCVGIDVNELAFITMDDRRIKIARSIVSRLEMHRAKGHQLKSLRNGMRQSLRWGFNSLFSPWVPVGAIVIPGTLAWGAVAVPFCLLGDLRAKVAGMQEIKPN